MTLNSKLISLIFLFVSSYFLSQNIETIYLKKDNSKFLFFQKGKSNDTIIPSRTDLFYLLLSDSIKQNYFIESENAQLITTTNDSLVILKYLSGIKYQNKFVPFENEIESLNENPNPKGRKEKLKMIALIDGASLLDQKKIKISFINKYNGQSFAEFFYFSSKN